MGVAKGLTKGLVGLTMKTGSATIGLVVYPSQGVYRGLRRSVRKGVEKKVEEGRWVEGEDIMRRGDWDGERVCGVLDEIMCSREI